MKKEFTDLENANAILNGQDDCHQDFVDCFEHLHKKPIDNEYMYDWLLRSLVDVSKVNYSLLYVACGTAGYLRLFKNIKKFVGLDFSKKMITAAKRINSKRSFDCDFHCTTLENYKTDEKFDSIYLCAYGHYVPYTFEALKISKKLLHDDGMIFCTISDPMFSGYYSRFKEIVKQVLFSRTFKYDKVRELEKMLNKSDLQIHLKLRMKTSIGYAYCYIVKKNNA